MTTPEAVLSYWFSPAPQSAEAAGERMGFWFSGGERVDQEIRERFASTVESAGKGELDDWATSPRGALALIIVLDQFTRNLHRGSALAFANDERALRLTRQGHDSGWFAEFDTLERLFAALPFCHSEKLEDQVHNVALVTRLALDAPPHLRGVMNASVDWARKHLDVVARFGRFPHRNQTLGRTPTEAERDYLAHLELMNTWL